MVIVPGLGSRKENHMDMGGALAAAGLAALAIDVRGHGASAGRLDGGSVDDVRAALDWLAARGHRSLGLRGSSMGALLALVGGDDPRVGAVVAICTARPAALARRLGDDWPRALSVEAAVRRPGVARFFLHATGDRTVPWAHSFHLATLAPNPVRLRVAVGGDHGSLQHAPERIDATVDFFREYLR
ncbi:MAG TPA: alpha/beta hydrolase [Miltoncostaeaceae bacterium]|nr:alpha/beta hydrolase [Miltoncostaeaceae bacterium]